MAPSLAGLSVWPSRRWAGISPSPGRWSHPWWLLLAITLAVATWVAGFDIFYALPDEAFDRNQGLRSAVVRLGRGAGDPAGQAAPRRHHPGAGAVRVGAGFGLWYFAGVVVGGGILVWEHQLVRPGDLSRLDAAFFTMNGVMTVTVFVFALMDRLTQ